MVSSSSCRWGGALISLEIESRAICRYLEAKYKGRGTELIPSQNAQSLGLFEQAASTETSYFDPFASGIVFERVFKKSVRCSSEFDKFSRETSLFFPIRMMNRGETDERRVEEMTRQLNEKLDVYEKILSKRPYLAGQVRAVRSKLFVDQRLDL